MKIYVYAICKNEEKFVNRWVNSMSEADGIYALDTGSTDQTVSKLKARGVFVTSKIINPWRFDVARNLSLELVPSDADLCVCTDLDEVFEKGWRDKMQASLSPSVTNLSYRYAWNFNPDGSEGVVFWMSKAHRRDGFKWVNPVHEVLSYDGKEIIAEAKGVQLNHYADLSKPRSQYLPLLELSVKENPLNDRNVHYLGREYMFYGKWQECINTLKYHLTLSSATWADERAASMRFIARAYIQLNDRQTAYQYLLRAIAEAPHLREALIETACFELENKSYAGALYFSEKALEIQKRSKTYINEAESWGAKPYDIAAIASYYLGLFEKAKKYGEKAVSFSPNDDRLTKNLQFYAQKFHP